MFSILHLKGCDYVNYYDEIKNKIIDNEIYLKVKDYSKEKNYQKN